MAATAASSASTLAARCGKRWRPLSRPGTARMASPSMRLVTKRATYTNRNGRRAIRSVGSSASSNCIPRSPVACNWSSETAWPSCAALRRKSFRRTITSIGCSPSRSCHDFDYIVGSVHHVNGISIDESGELYRAAVDASGGFEPFAERYYDTVRHMIEGLRPEIVGHLDLVKLHAPAGADQATGRIRRGRGRCAGHRPGTRLHPRPQHRRLAQGLGRPLPQSMARASGIRNRPVFLLRRRQSRFLRKSVPAWNERSATCWRTA